MNQKRSAIACQVAAGIVLHAASPVWAQTPADPGDGSGPQGLPAVVPGTRPPKEGETPPTRATDRGSPANVQPGDFLAPHYDDGFVLVSSRDPERQPFRLKLKHVSQFKYTNSWASTRPSRTTSGGERDVLRRHDIQLTRDVFYFSGYAFDPRLDFNILIFTSSATLSATAAGYVGYAFHEAFKLRAGFFSLPSLRAMTGTYPFFPGTDRSMAVNYMRPGFTQGIWAEGHGAARLQLHRHDRQLPQHPGHRRHQDRHASSPTRRRSGTTTTSSGCRGTTGSTTTRWPCGVGTAFTFAREDRLSDLSTASPENNAIFMSDGDPAVRDRIAGAGRHRPAGELLPVGGRHGPEVPRPGVQRRGLRALVEPLRAPTGRCRWSRCTTGASRPRSAISCCAAGSSSTSGPPRQRPVRDAIEGGGGVHLYPFDTRNVWLNLEGMGIKDSPYGSVYYVYSAGQTGFLLQSQFMLRF